MGIQSILGQKVNFEDPRLLVQALTHRSANKRNNERLEFLGDSILQFVTTKWLYHRYPKLSEGKLSRMRSSLVKGVTLAEVARYYKLSNELILGAGELKSGGFNRSSVLADTVEAIFGAIFVDQGIEVVEKTILRVMDHWFHNVDPNTSDKDAKTRLQEYLQKNAMHVPEYKLIAETGKDHLRTFTIECIVSELDISKSATKRSRKKAEQQAAHLILEEVNKSNGK